MILQQLVENAVKHGISKLRTGGEIHVAAEVAGGNLEVRVENTGALAKIYNSGVGYEMLESDCGSWAAAVRASIWSR